MKQPRGFALLPALLIILGVLAVSGGVYWYTHSPVLTPQTLPLSATLLPVNGITDGPNVGCYYTQNGAIFVKGSSGYTQVLGADLPSFKDDSIYGLCFAKDKNHVYRDTSILSGFDPATFILLSYMKPGPVLMFHIGGSLQAFEFSQDLDSAFVGIKKLPNSDATTFKEFLSGYDFNPWAGDKNNLYCGGTIIPGTPSTAKVINTGEDLQVKVSGVLRVYDRNCSVVDSASQTVSVPGMSQYTDTDFGFSFWYPSAWKVVKHHSGSSSDSEMEILISAPPFGADSVQISLYEHYADTAPVVAADPAAVIRIAANKFLIMGGHPDNATYIPLAKTIVATDPSVATPVSAAEQVKVIQAEKAAYTTGAAIDQNGGSFSFSANQTLTGIIPSGYAIAQVFIAPNSYKGKTDHNSLWQLTRGDVNNPGVSYAGTQVDTSGHWSLPLSYLAGENPMPGTYKLFLFGVPPNDPMGQYRDEDFQIPPTLLFTGQFTLTQ